MTVYKYLFYRLYKLLRRGEMAWWTDFRTSLMLSVFEILILALIEFKITMHWNLAGEVFYGKWGYIALIASLSGPSELRTLATASAHLEECQE